MRKALAMTVVLCALFGAFAGARAAPQSVSIMADTPLSLAVLQKLAPLLERGGALRILPVSGKGPVQTLTDLATLHSVDAALVSSDTLAYMQRNGLLQGQDGRLAFLVKLGGIDVHVVARKGIDTVGDLAGKRVVTGRTGGEAFVAGEFIKSAVNPPPLIVPGDGIEALRAVTEGKADAAILVGHRPMPEITSLAQDSGLHLIPLEVPGGYADIYAPSLISHDDYPNLVSEDFPVETVSAALAIATFNWKKGSPQYDKERALSDALFAALAPSPASDSGLNLAAGVPGWTRHAAAAEALAALPHASQ